MEKYTDAFREFLTVNKGGAVLVSGGGGSGKSEILSAFRLMPEMADPATVTASLDLSLEVNIDSELGLLALRNELIRYYKINFSFFDVAYALYLVRTNPGKKLDRDLDLYTNSKIINEVLGVAGAKGNEFVNKLYFTVERGKPAVTEWWRNEGGAELNRLMEETPESVRKNLINQWAKDLKLALQGRKCIITVDSFENIYGEDGSGRKHGADKWIKELMGLLPEVTFILSGRELPEWAENEAPKNTLSLEAGLFDRNDTAYLLEHYGLTDRKLCDAVFASARGDKLLTTLLAAGLSGVKKETGKEPSPEQVEYGAKEIMLFYNASTEGREGDMARLLSVCRCFSREVFEYLIYEFIPEGVKFTFSDYCMLPSVSPNIGLDCAALKKPFREELYASLNSDQKDNVHFSLFNFYLKKIDRERGSFRTYGFYLNFRECFHHAKSALDGEGFVDWFMDSHAKYFSNDKMGFWIHLHGEVVEYLKGLMGLINPYTAICMERLAQMYVNVEDYGRAEPLLKRMVNIREKLSGAESLDTVRSRNKLASMYSAKGDFPSAMEIMGKNAEIKSRTEGPDHPETLKYLQKLALFAMKNKDFKTAADIGERSLRLHIQRLGRENSDTVKAMSELAAISEMAGDFERACELFKEVLEIREKSLGGSHPETAKSLSQLAFYFYRRGEYDSAEPLFYRALEAKETQLGHSHPLIASYCNNLGYIYYCREKYDRAEAMYEKSLKIKEKNFGASHPSTLTGVANLAALKFRKGEIEEAEALFRKVLEQSVSTFGEKSSETATDMTNLAYVVSRKGDFSEAEALCRNALSMREEEDAQDTAATLNNLGEILFRKGQTDEASDILEKAYAAAESALGSHHPVVRRILDNLEKVRDRIH
ncbi:tetratricopeptide repeat protein [Geovibrio thiophilus]|nr:tetratricopeptide repeat protein [Geovibrio thiophilus]